MPGTPGANSGWSCPRVSGRREWPHPSRAEGSASFPGRSRDDPATKGSLAYFLTGRYISEVSLDAPIPALRPSTPVSLGPVLAHAAAFNFSRFRTTQEFMDAANLPLEVEAFFRLLDERAVPYLLVGGVAMLAHVRGRNTEDIDFVVSTPDQDRLAPEVSIIERKGFFTVGRFRENLRVEFRGAENPLLHLSPASTEKCVPSNSWKEIGECPVPRRQVWHC